jgi:hypothetical protein
MKAYTSTSTREHIHTHFLRDNSTTVYTHTPCTRDVYYTKLLNTFPTHTTVQQHT